MASSPKSDNSKFGDLGEKFALRLLKIKGYKVICTKFRSKFGEIDIIAEKDNTLIFVEVKTRWSLKFGLPQEAVNFRKMVNIKRTGEYFSLLNPNLPKKLAIEIVAIQAENNRVTSAKIIRLD